MPNSAKRRFLHYWLVEYKFDSATIVFTCISLGFGFIGLGLVGYVGNNYRLEKANDRIKELETALAAQRSVTQQVQAKFDSQSSLSVSAPCVETKMIEKPIVPTAQMSLNATMKSDEVVYDQMDQQGRQIAKLHSGDRVRLNRKTQGSIFVFNNITTSKGVTGYVSDRSVQSDLEKQ